MANVLDGCLKKLRLLLDEIDNLQGSYNAVRDALDADNGQLKYSLSDASTMLHIQTIDGTEGRAIPVLVPAECITDVGGAMLAAKARMGESLVQTWEEVFSVATAAKAHCDAAIAHAIAVQDAEQAPTELPPPAPLPPPSPLPPAARPPQATIPRLKPVVTSEVPTRR